ncbi:hypothetical protein QAD02_022026 [Eretmocerus hayati]|uniref:Uncharacterized protein n=1 Tax=Eretmocerus hayati TaxID=131215 RepID=A0ACC2PV35_9HYME|nr:hypothetical protein QAD02_022026 [Eretmocerus hayati]
MDNDGPLAELQKICDRPERELPLEYVVIQSSPRKVVLRAKPMKVTTSEQKTAKYEPIILPNCEQNVRIDNVRIEKHLQNLPGQYKLLPTPAPAPGVITGVRPFNPLYTWRTNEKYELLKQLYESGRSEMLV